MGIRRQQQQQQRKKTTLEFGEGGKRMGRRGWELAGCMKVVVVVVVVVVGMVEVIGRRGSIE